MYLLIKGKLGNFMHSLTDYLERRSDLIKRYPPGTFLWGTNRRSAYIHENIDVLLYIARDVNFQGGIVLYGTLMKPEELSTRYWPEGTWTILLPIKVIKLAKGVAENPRDPSKWKTITYEELKALGVKPLPGTNQRIENDIAKKIIERLG